MPAVVVGLHHALLSAGVGAALPAAESIPRKETNTCSKAVPPKSGSASHGATNVMVKLIEISSYRYTVT